MFQMVQLILKWKKVIINKKNYIMNVNLDFDEVLNYCEEYGCELNWNQKIRLIKLMFAKEYNKHNNKEIADEVIKFINDNFI